MAGLEGRYRSSREDDHVCGQLQTGPVKDNGTEIAVPRGYFLFSSPRVQKRDSASPCLLACNCCLHSANALGPRQALIADTARHCLVLPGAGGALVDRTSTNATLGTGPVQMRLVSDPE